MEGGFWGAADVRDAASLTPEAFKRDYMLAGKPVIIRGDPGSVALAAALTLDTLLTMCGELSPDLGNRIVEVVQHGRGPAIPAIPAIPSIPPMPAIPAIPPIPAIPAIPAITLLAHTCTSHGLPKVTLMSHWLAGRQHGIPPPLQQAISERLQHTDGGAVSYT